jgi:predicted metalloendopeptidase
MELANEKPRLQDDFYNNVNFDWLKNNPIPSEYTKWSNFHVLMERNQNRLKEMLETAPVTEEQKKLNVLWTQGQNSSELNKNGLNDVYSSYINTTSNLDLNREVISLMKNNSMFLFQMEAYSDLKDSSRNILYFDVPNLSMPDRDYYLSDKMADKRTDFKEFLRAFLPHTRNTANADDVYSFEESIANVVLSKTDRRDPYKVYNLYTFSELVSEFPGINWNLIFQQFLIPTNDKIVVAEPAYFKYLSEYLIKCTQNQNEAAKLVNYLNYRLASAYATYVDDATYNLYFEFYGRKLMGQKEPRQRWKRVLSTVERTLGEVLSKVYVQTYFTEADKNACKNMIQEIIKTFENSLKTLEWMSEETKVKALEKLSTFTVKIGYPDKWTDFSSLMIESSQSYCKNIMECNKWTLHHNLDKLYQPVDRSEWHMNAHDINAYYSPPTNEIVFPAGILQEPFFSQTQSLSENLGGIGAVIAHEITHGFDDQGCLYDSCGNLNNWWTTKDKESFDARSGKLEQLFSSYTFCGICVNGKLTLGENIADLGGLTVAMNTLQRLVSPANLTEEQVKLFSQWAKVWRCNITQDTLKNQLLTDPHSPTQLRTNGILRNIDEFYRVFNITEADSMYLNPELRSKIW